MKRQNKWLFFLIAFLTTSLGTAAVNNKSEESKLLEELTGKKQIKKPVIVAPKVVTINNTPISRRHLDAGFLAFTKKNYILALKHYNTIIVKFPKSKEVKSAFLAKAKLYQEMGLSEQSNLNLKLANEIDKTIK